MFYHPSRNSRRVAKTAIQLIGTIIADAESSREYGNRVAVLASLVESLPQRSPLIGKIAPGNREI